MIFAGWTLISYVPAPCAPSWFFRVVAAIDVVMGSLLIVFSTAAVVMGNLEAYRLGLYITFAYVPPETHHSSYTS